MPLPWEGIPAALLLQGPSPAVHTMLCIDTAVSIKHIGLTVLVRFECNAHAAAVSQLCQPGWVRAALWHGPGVLVHAAWHRTTAAGVRTFHIHGCLHSHLRAHAAVTS